MVLASGSRRVGHKQNANSRSIANVFIIKATTGLIIALIVVPILFIILSDSEFDMLTGKVTESIMQIDAEIVITINDSTFFVGEEIDFSECGFSTRDQDITCTFSPPLDYNLGTWIPTTEDIGSYFVEINATDGLLETSKIIELTIVEELTGNCDMYFDIYGDHRIMIYWDEEVIIGEDIVEYNNFSLSYTDYLINGTFNMEDASTITGITEGQYFDSTANETKERYYKLSAVDDLGRRFECEDVFGKYTRDLTTSFGRWNYISSPFIRRDKSFFEFIDEAKNDLEFVYKYNHDTGNFDFHFFEIDFGNFDEVNYNECLLLQPLRETRITTAGKIMKNISANLTTSFGRWNYIGWVAEYTEKSKAFAGHTDDIEFFYIYDQDTGNFRFHFFEIDFGNIDEIPPTTCNLIQPYTPTTYEYNI